MVWQMGFLLMTRTLDLMRDTRLRIEIRVFIMILYLMASTLFWLRINYLMRKTLCLL